MSLTATEEALVRQLLDQQAAILSLASNEATITSKLGATKVTLADLVAASGVADADLLLTRQGTTDKSVRADILAAYMAAGLNLSALAPKASPALTGTPTAPTATPGTDDTQIATTAFVQAATNPQPSITGSATLNGTTDNTVQLTAIVTTLGLEVGDVVRIQYSGYNKLHTVESITNNNLIVVNYEHAGNRGDGSLKLADQTATATITRIAKWYNAPAGMGQAWVNVISIRTAGVTYQNLSGRPFQIGATGLLGSDNNGDLRLTVSGVVYGFSETGYVPGRKYMYCNAVVQTGGTYSRASSSVTTLWELR